MEVLAFLSYAREDAVHRDALERHIDPLRRAGRLRIWHDGLVPAGADRGEEIRKRLEEASLVLILISADYLASDACQGEMDRAIDRASGGGSTVVPVILRPCLVGRDRIAAFAALPADGRPITVWQNQDSAWTSVAEGVDALLGGAVPSLPASAAAISAPAASDPPVEERLRLLGEIEDARVRRKRLVEVGTPTAEVDAEILHLKRQLREGGRLRQGDLLGGHYTLLKRLGRGGFATVWEAEDRETRERVAVKVLHANVADDPERKERFFRGARIMSELRHDAIVRVIEPHEEDGGFSYFVMELVTGGDLQTAVLAGRVPAERAVPLILRVGDALSAAHARGFVHRDVKPANILLDDRGEPKLSDFDLVRGPDTTGGTQTGAMGSFLYAAPEVMSRPQDADARADVFGLGMCALFCLYGKALPDVAFRDPSRVLADLGRPAIAAVIAKAIEWEPAKRYESVTAFSGALRAAWEEQEEAEPRDAPKEAPPTKEAPSAAVLSKRLLLAGTLGLTFLVGYAFVTGGFSSLLGLLPKPRPNQFPELPAEDAAAPDASPSSAPSAPAAMSASASATTVSASASAPFPPVPKGKCPEGMAAIYPPKSVRIGSLGNLGRPDELPRYQTFLKPYCLDRTEVTLPAYERCVADNRCPRLGDLDLVCMEHPVYPGSEPSHAVACFTWQGAADYCTALGGRLPTEEEWEFAARGPEERTYPWGRQPPKDQLCWSGIAGSPPRTASCPVGIFPEGDSFSRISDMAGNVAEWTSTTYCPYSNRRCADPRRVVRGGSYVSKGSADVRAAARDAVEPTTRSAQIGFRCARDL